MGWWIPFASHAYFSVFALGAAMPLSTKIEAHVSATASDSDLPPQIQAIVQSYVDQLERDYAADVEQEMTEEARLYVSSLLPVAGLGIGVAF